MDAKLFAGLTELAAGAFPKSCNTCGRIYNDAYEYLNATQPVSATRSGLKQSQDEDGHTIVEAFRNCVCGSTLMDMFNNRRNVSDEGLKRRKRFGELLEYLVGQMLERELARKELLKVLRGEGSNVLKDFKPPARK